MHRKNLGENMILRRMKMDDADKMLEWKNYPETREFTIVSNEKIKKADHLKYLKENLDFFRIVIAKGKVAGAVRIKDNEIAIWIDRSLWGQGLATQVIKWVSRKGMIAKIVEGNISSMKAFIKAGYVPQSYIKGRYDIRSGRIVNYYIFVCSK